MALTSTPPLDPDALDALVERIVGRLAERLRADADKLLTRGELAARLRISQRTVSDAVARGELPPPLRPAAGLVRWRWATVLKHLEGRSARHRRKGRGIRRTASAAGGSRNAGGREATPANGNGGPEEGARRG